MEEEKSQVWFKMGWFDVCMQTINGLLQQYSPMLVAFKTVVREIRERQTSGYQVITLCGKRTEARKKHGLRGIANGWASWSGA